MLFVGSAAWVPLRLWEVPLWCLWEVWPFVENVIEFILLRIAYKLLQKQNIPITESMNFWTMNNPVCAKSGRLDVIITRMQVKLQSTESEYPLDFRKAIGHLFWNS